MKTLSTVLRLSVLLLVLQARCAWSVEIPTGAPAPLGDWGDPGRVSVEGSRTFSEGDIRRSLRTDLDYLVAAHPESTLAECLATLEDRIRIGYRHRGFPEVAVQARFDKSAGRIVVKVTEGPRFRCGTIQVSGLKAIPTAEFTRRLAEKLAPPADQPGTTSGTWRTGTPTSFTPKSLSNYSMAVTNTFLALGRFMPKFTVTLVPDPSSNEATLTVIVAHEGPAALLREIAVLGNHKNGRDSIIGFLGLSKGMEITQDLIDEKARSLKQAARFIDSSITPTALGQGGEVSQTINVVEKDTFPPLALPLSRVEKTMLRLHEWLMSWESRQEDLIVSWSPKLPDRGGHIDFIISPAGGIMARALRKSPGQKEPQDLHSIVVTTETVALYAQVHERKLRFPLPTGCSGVIFADLVPCTNCPSGFNLTLGAGLSPSGKETGWRLRLDLSPAAFTDLVCRKGTEANWQDGVLTVLTSDFFVRVDEATGRLLEAGSIAGKSGPASGAPGAGVSLRFAAGAFTKAKDRIEAATSTFPDAFQRQRALGSVLGFVAAEAMSDPWLPASPTSGNTSPGARLPLGSALEKLLSSSFLDPLQSLLDGSETSGRHEEFTIPSSRTMTQDGTREMFERVMVWCAGHAQELAPEGSWLRTVLRESAFTLKSRTEHTSAALARLAASEQIGPVGCNIVLHALQGPEEAFARLGLRRLATKDFRRDYRMLLSSESVITRCLGNLARELGKLTRPEVEAIAGLLSPDSAAVVRELAAAALKGKDLPVSDAIGPALDRWWETTARQGVEADFRQYAK